MKRVLLLVLALAAGAGVWWATQRGDEEVSGFLVRIDTLPEDGPVPPPVYARSMDTKEPATPIELVPVPDRERTYLAPGGRAGHYEIFSAAGWRMIQDSMQMPRFEPGSPPKPVAMGRPRCLYVFRDPHSGFQVESVVAVERIEGTPRESTYRLIKAEIIEHIDGWFGVRLPANEVVAKARFRISGWLAGQVPFEPIILNVGDAPDRPYVKFARPAPVAQLRVLLIGTPDVPVNDIEVTATMVGLPIKMMDVVRTINGEALFPSLGTFQDGVLLQVPSWGVSDGYPISIDQWRREGTVFLRALDPKTARWIDLEVPEGASITHIAGLSEQTSEFALLPVAKQDGAWRVQLPPDLTSWIVYNDEQVTYRAIAVPDREGGKLTLSEPTRGVTVHGRLNTARAGYRVRFERRVGDRWVGGVGMEVDVRVGHRYETRLAPGRYRVRVVHPGGRLGKPMTLDWGPGANVELPLEIR